MDIALLAGLGLSVILVLMGMLGGVPISTFINLPSALLTVGGSLGATIASLPLKTITGLGGVMSAAMKGVTLDAVKLVTTLVNLAYRARKEGLLSLEEAISEIEDDFLKRGVQLVVDGVDPESVRGILEADIEAMQARHAMYKKIFDYWGELAPAYGMIGTIVGLIKMLKQLDDPSTIGPSMALALITTLYGSMVANIFMLPIGKKLAANDEIEASIRQMVVEGLLAIQAGENPRVLEERLKSFLSPADRKAVEEALGGGGGGE